MSVLTGPLLLEAAGLKQTVGQRATSIYTWTTRIKIWSEMELMLLL